MSTPDPTLLQQIEGVLDSTAGRHPGIIAEAVVERLTGAYELLPREPHHRERRKNHVERIRRFAHEVYRVLADGEALDPAREIAARVAKAFVVAPKAPPVQQPQGEP